MKDLQKVARIEGVTYHDDYEPKALAFSFISKSTERRLLITVQSYERFEHVGVMAFPSEIPTEEEMTEVKVMFFPQEEIKQLKPLPPVGVNSKVICFKRDK